MATPTTSPSPDTTAQSNGYSENAANALSTKVTPEATSAASQPAASSAAAFPAYNIANNSLYVGELSFDVTEAMLFEIFNEIGPVASIRVCRDAVTRRSLGYAYVNFHNPADGERALEAMNYSFIKGRPCRIMWSQRDPALRKKGQGNIFIKNLDKTIDSKALYDTFQAFGPIHSCKVAMDEGGSRGYGFVHFELQESAEKAIKSVNGMLLNDKKVFVGLHIPRRERESKFDEFKASFTNIFVKNISETVTQQQFSELFGAFGSVTSSALAMDENEKSRGFGFVNYDEHESASKTVEAMNGKEVGGKELFVGRAQKKSEREDELRDKFEQFRLERITKYQGVNLYVKNLDDAIDDEQLRQEFAVFGAITSAKVMRDEKSASRGFGFVCFASQEEATKALTEMNNKMIGQKPIFVALAQRKEARRAMLEAQYAARTQVRQQAAGGILPMYSGAPQIMFPGAGMPQGMPPQSFMFANNMGRPAVPYLGMQQQFPASNGSPHPSQRTQPRQNGVLPPAMQQQMMQQQRGAARVMQTPQNIEMMQQQQMQQQQLQQQQMQRMQQQQAPRTTNGSTGNASTRPPAANPNAQIEQRPVAGARPPLTMAALSKLEPAQQRQLIGERLFALVQSHPIVPEKHKAFAGKITGMFLEMEGESAVLADFLVADLLHMLDSSEVLEEKLSEAVEVLNQFLQLQQKDN